LDYDQLIFIEERPSNNKPDFYDAIRISNKNDSYQSIPIPYFYDPDTKITYNQHSLKLESSQPLTKEEALRIFQTFAVKKGNKGAYFAQCPNFPLEKNDRQMKRTRKRLKL
jgi:hypothetical protein